MDLERTFEFSNAVTVESDRALQYQEIRRMRASFGFCSHGDLCHLTINWTLEQPPTHL